MCWFSQQQGNTTGNQHNSSRQNNAGNFFQSNPNNRNQKFMNPLTCSFAKGTSPLIPALINGYKVTATLDTGAEVSIVDYHILQHLDITASIMPTDSFITRPAQQEVPIMGTCYLSLNICGIDRTVLFYALSHVHPAHQTNLGCDSGRVRITIDFATSEILSAFDTEELFFSETVLLPPTSGLYVALTVKNTALTSVLLRPNHKLNEQFVPPGYNLHTVHRHEILVPFISFSSDLHVIQKGLHDCTITKCDLTESANDDLYKPPPPSSPKRSPGFPEPELVSLLH